jgi:Protein of unknown function (DUF2975)
MAKISAKAAPKTTPQSATNASVAALVVADDGDARMDLAVTSTKESQAAVTAVPVMKRTSTVFLQLLVVLIGIGALALLLWEPHTEGVNAHATFFQVYLDSFIALVYAGSIPFFVAVYQAFKVLGYAGKNKICSPAAVKALRTIKYCAVTIIGFVAVEEIVIMFNNSDDRAGGVFMGVLITFGSIVIAAAAAMFERILQNTAANLGPRNRDHF